MCGVHTLTHTHSHSLTHCSLNLCVFSGRMCFPVVESCLLNSVNNNHGNRRNGRLKIGVYVCVYVGLGVYVRPNIKSFQKLIVLDFCASWERIIPDKVDGI